VLNIDYYPIIWGVTYLSGKIVTIPNEYYKIFWKIFWIVFEVNLVKIRGGSGRAMLGYGLLAWLTNGISFLFLPLLFWSLVKYEKGVNIFYPKHKVPKNR